jgi:hypothetical protein
MKSVMRIRLIGVAIDALVWSQYWLIGLACETYTSVAEGGDTSA